MSISEKMDYTTNSYLDQLVDFDPTNIAHLMERAILHYKNSKPQLAYNDIVRVLDIEPDNEQALHYSKLLKMVMNFEYKENINV